MDHADGANVAAAVGTQPVLDGLRVDAALAVLLRGVLAALLVALALLVAAALVVVLLTVAVLLVLGVLLLLSVLLAVALPVVLGALVAVLRALALALAAVLLVLALGVLALGVLGLAVLRRGALGATSAAARGLARLLLGSRCALGLLVLLDLGLRARGLLRRGRLDLLGCLLGGGGLDGARGALATGGLDGVDQLALAQLAGVADAEAGRDLAQLGEDLAPERAARATGGLGGGGGGRLRRRGRRLVSGGVGHEDASWVGGGATGPPAKTGAPWPPADGGRTYTCRGTGSTPTSVTLAVRSSARSAPDERGQGPSFRTSGRRGHRGRRRRPRAPSSRRGRRP